MPLKPWVDYWSAHKYSGRILQDGVDRHLILTITTYSRNWPEGLRKFRAGSRHPVLQAELKVLPTLLFVVVVVIVVSERLNYHRSRTYRFQELDVCQLLYCVNWRAIALSSPANYVVSDMVHRHDQYRWTVLDVRYVVQSFQLVIKYTAHRLLGGCVSIFVDLPSSATAGSISASSVWRPCDIYHWLKLKEEIILGGVGLGVVFVFWDIS